MSSDKQLNEVVTVERRFQRSIRLDADLGQFETLQGYVAHQSAKTAIQTTLKLIKSGQGAFTWTGPYGGGKSSLALAFASCFSPDLILRKQARKLLGTVDGLDKVVPLKAQEWLTVALTGRRGDPVSDIRNKLAESIADESGRARTKKTKSEDAAGRDIIERLLRECEARENGGVVIIIDEMGKFLEAASDRSIDIHFFQDLAEAANRSNGRLIVIGILHQAFERYAERLGSRVQDEWSKIQGRYIDIPVITAIDEVIDLIGRAVDCSIAHPASKKTSKAIAKSISNRRPGTPTDLADRLDDCWPLHPVTASLLGPISRRKFGQNERSVFGFLASAEPNGFADYLSRTATSSSRMFEPSDLWDYLQVNLEPAILTSPDGHRWAQAVEAVERAKTQNDWQQEKVAKTIAIIDLFQNGSGVTCEPGVISASNTDLKSDEVIASLERLTNSSIIVYRRHLEAYAIFAGSDFDIDAEVGKRLSAKSGLDVSVLNQAAALQPVMAKKYHSETGTPRWFDCSISLLKADGIPKKDLAVSRGSAGKFVLALPVPEIDEADVLKIVSKLPKSSDDGRSILIGIPPNAEAIALITQEYEATRDVQQHSPELEGDSVARRELSGRMSALTASLEEALRIALNTSKWFGPDGVLAKPDDLFGLSRLASDLAQATFNKAPKIRSELINRQRPSGNTNGALRGVLHAIAKNNGEPHFAIEGYPPERGLISAVYEAPGLYAEQNGQWEFVDPSSSNNEEGQTFRAIWDVADSILDGDKQAAFSEIYDAWEQPPYGVRRGVMPMLGVAYLFTRKERAAIYVQSTFQPDITDLVMDMLLQDPSQVSLRGVKNSKGNRSTLTKLSDKAEKLVGWKPPAEPLPVAQALVEFVFKLPNWSKKAQAAISPKALKVRRALLDADDPHQLFTVDLPQAVGDETKNFADDLCSLLDELHNAYPTMLNGLKKKMLSSLKHQNTDLHQLRERASAIFGRGGDDLKLNGFISRLASFEGTIEETADICGLVTSMPVQNWHDLEPSRALMQLADYAYRFRRVELFGGADEQPTQTAVMVMAGVGADERSVTRRAQISVDEQAAISPIVDKIDKLLDEAGLGQDGLLAVIAELAQRRLESDGENDITIPIIAEDQH